MKLRSAVLVVMSLSRMCWGSLPADLNYDGTVNLSDFAAFGSQWLEKGTQTPGKGFVIAAANASPISKQRADYVCDGVDDQVEIQAAIDQFPLIGTDYRCGRIHLTEGDFHISSPIVFGNSGNRVVGSITGAGSLYSTRLILVKNSNCSILQVGHDYRWDDPNSTRYCRPAWLDLKDMTFEGDAEAPGLIEHKYSITGIDQSNNKFILAGVDATSQIRPYNAIRVMGSKGNNGYYIVRDCTSGGSLTEVTVVRDIPSDLADGKIKAEWPLVNAAKWQDGVCNHCFFQKSNGDGVWIKDTWTLKFNDSVFEHNNNNGLFVYCTSYYTATNLVVNQAVFINNRRDSTAGLMVMFSPINGAGDVKTMWVTNSYFRSGTGDGIHLMGGVKYFKIMGNHMHDMGLGASYRHYGIRLEAPPGSSGPQHGIIADNDIRCYPALKAAIGLINNSDSVYPDFIDIHDNHIEGKSPVIDMPGKPTNKRGRSFDMVHETFTDISASDVNSLIADLDIGDARNECVTFDTARQMDYPRNVALTITHNAGGNLRGRVIVYGNTSYIADDEYEVFELDLGAGSHTLLGEKVWRELHTLCVDFTGGSAGTGDTLQLGAGSKFLLNYPFHKESDVVSVRKNGRLMSLSNDAPKNYDADGGSNSIDFNFDSYGRPRDQADRIKDGDDFIVYYKKSLNRKNE